jgi:cob(I)alamin adenosyltransferase
MVRIDRVTTRGGDSGETSLGDGSRVRKDSLRIEAIGCVDEANSAIGVLRLAACGNADADAMLARIQQDLFDVGADLCVPGQGGDRLRVTETLTARLEQETGAMNVTLLPLASFVVPGGCPGAAQAHVARGAVRRAERSAVALSREEAVNAAVLRYLNRLSDHLFVLARWLNQAAGGAGDALWTPGANR